MNCVSEFRLTNTHRNQETVTISISVLVFRRVRGYGATGRGAPSMHSHAARGNEGKKFRPWSSFRPQARFNLVPRLRLGTGILEALPPCAPPESRTQARPREAELPRLASPGRAWVREYRSLSRKMSHFRHDDKPCRVGCPQRSSASPAVDRSSSALDSTRI